MPRSVRTSTTRPIGKRSGFGPTFGSAAAPESGGAQSALCGPVWARPSGLAGARPDCGRCRKDARACSGCNPVSSGSCTSRPFIGPPRSGPSPIVPNRRSDRSARPGCAVREKCGDRDSWGSGLSRPAPTPILGMVHSIVWVLSEFADAEGGSSTEHPRRRRAFARRETRNARAWRTWPDEARRVQNDRPGTPNARVVPGGPGPAHDRPLATFGCEQ